MTNPQNGPEGPETPAPDDHAGDGSLGPENGSQGQESPNKEAAKYRTKLRETETERDGLRDKLNGYLTREAERIATTDPDPGKYGPHLWSGDDLWRYGVELNDVLDDDGQVSETKVREKVDAISVDHGHILRTRVGAKPDKSQASGANGRTPKRSAAGDLAEMLKRGAAWMPSGSI